MQLPLLASYRSWSLNTSFNRDDVLADTTDTAQSAPYTSSLKIVLAKMNPSDHGHDLNTSGEGRNPVLMQFIPTPSGNILCRQRQGLGRRSIEEVIWKDSTNAIQRCKTLLPVPADRAGDRSSDSDTSP